MACFSQWASAHYTSKTKGSSNTIYSNSIILSLFAHGSSSCVNDIYKYILYALIFNCTPFLKKRFTSILCRKISCLLRTYLLMLYFLIVIRSICFLPSFIYLWPTSYHYIIIDWHRIWPASTWYFFLSFLSSWSIGSSSALTSIAWNQVILYLMKEPTLFGRSWWAAFALGLYGQIHFVLQALLVKLRTIQQALIVPFNLQGIHHLCHKWWFAEKHKNVLQYFIQS